MPDIITDGKTRVAWVPTIANLAAPDISSELASATDLSCLITADGVIGFEPETADVDNSALCSTFDTKVGGRASWSNTALRLKKQAQTGDTVYDLLLRDTQGYLVIRRGLPVATAWGAGQEVEVYPIYVGEVKNLPPEANSVQKYEIPMKISSQPDLRAILVA